MDKLRNLQQMASLASGRFNQYDGKDFILPQEFKDQVKEINSNTITYNKYSAIIETKGFQRGILNIFLPNQWFYIASYFTDFYNELLKYKNYALKITTKDRLKVLNGDKLTESETNSAYRLGLDEESVNHLIRFITDYSWWGGAKTIDRGDFYVSPILAYANLVNASQSYVADLCAFLADKQDLVQAIINKEGKNALENQIKSQKQPLQQIFYGAPGTGKSNTIKKEVDEQGKKCFRTTFHPDSDYSTFVGCYKPTMKHGERIYTQAELVAKLKDIKNTGVSYPCHKFSTKYWKSLKELSTEEIRQILNACGFTDSMSTEIGKGIAIGQEFLNSSEDGKIIYSFCPQVFTNAYVEAWGTNEDVYLVIEEINRGNCAQIFGDLFQLLDRKEGLSEYPVEADTDLQHYIGEKLANSTREDIPELVKQGKVLLLPNNLYIWATMNTSDQSLFPIDSAFKRRWDWQYMPICKGRDAKGEELQWSICAGDKRYDWWSFLEKINAQIGSTTNSEDKKLGYFFCKPFEGCISAETFVGKVVFYLWNDVFKDYGFDNTIFNDEEGGTLSFDKFYTINANGKVVVCEEKVVKFLENLGVEEVIKEIDYDREEEEESGENESTELKQIRYKYWSDLLDFIAKTPYENILKTQHRKPSERKYYDFYLGVSHCNLSIDYDSNIPNVGFWIGNQDVYNKIELRKAELEQICGPLKWISMNKAHKIRKEISIVGKSQEEQFKLYVDELVKMHGFFVKYIK